MSSYLEKYLLCHEKHVPFLGKKILDYGCGQGTITNLIKMLSGNGLVYGYDPDKFKIECAKKKERRNIFFTSSLENINGNKFESIFSSFVLHESGFKLINKMAYFLMPEGYLIVLDHDKKGISFDNFEEYLTEQDKKNHKELSIEDIWKQHTKYELKDCISFAENNGFKTIRAYAHKDLNFGAYLWIGKKLL